MTDDPAPSGHMPTEFDRCRDLDGIVTKTRESSINLNGHG